MLEQAGNSLEKFNGWKDENERADVFANFFRDYTRDTGFESKSGRRRYDSTEFHISGAGLTDKMRLGQTTPDSVRVYYEGGKVKRIHVCYYKPHVTDVYLIDKALEDFLKR